MSAAAGRTGGEGARGRGGRAARTPKQQPQQAATVEAVRPKASSSRASSSSSASRSISTFCASWSFFITATSSAWLSCSISRVRSLFTRSTTPSDWQRARPPRAASPPPRVSSSSSTPSDAVRKPPPSSSSSSSDESLAGSPDEDVRGSVVGSPSSKRCPVLDIASGGGCPGGVC